jgi:tRNA pseudouridine38-40 synthase
MSILLRKPMEVVGAGRTDTGVHARKMVAHFDYDEEVDCPQLVYKLNKLLPRDIAVQQVEPVAEDMHARFSAKSRTYHYFVHMGKNPFLRSYSWQVYGNIDFELMNQAASVLMEYKDFTSFSKVNTDTKTNDCTITEAHWDRVGEDQWCFTITANRFLRNMVRAIVGTLMEVGRGRMTIEQLRRVIDAKDRCCAGDSVPGNALFLVQVKY